MNPRSAVIAAILLGLILLATGIYLLKTAWWPRRRGARRHCKVCDYIIDSIDGVERCPECGTSVANGANILIGDRIRRPTRALAGLMLSILGLAIAAGGQAAISGGIDLYRTMPTSWVIRNAGSSSTTIAERAWAELDRRFTLNQLSEVHHRELTELALVEHAKPQPGPIGSELDFYLISRLELGKLNEAQMARFFKQAVRLELSVRKVVTAGDWPIYRSAHKERALAGHWFRYRELTLTVAGQKLQHTERWREPAENWRGGWSEGWFNAPEPGQHQIELIEEIEVYRGPEGDHAQSRLASTFTTRGVATFQSVPAELEASGQTRPSSYTDVELIEDPNLASQIKGRFTMDSFTIIDKTEPDGRKTQSIRGVFTQLSLPTDLGCEIIIRTGGPGAPEHRVMTLGVKANGGSFRHTVWADDVKLPASRKIDVLIRAGALPARRCPDIYKTWHGEIVFENVPVTEAPR